MLIAQSYEEAFRICEDMLSGKSFGEAGKLIVIEEFLEGFELSAFAVCDGTDFILLPLAQDHKRLKDNDEGPNTGGMGAYAPSTLADENLLRRIQRDIIIPTLNGMKAQNCEFSGVLFVGLMIVNAKPYVLEYNVRFGDPECEVLMPLIEDPLELLACVEKRLKHTQITIKNEFAVGVVCASANYPYAASKKVPIHIAKIPENTHISFAGVSFEQEQLMVDGGRVLVCVGLGKTIQEARNKAYELCENVHFEGKQYRKDIAFQVL